MIVPDNVQIHRGRLAFARLVPIMSVAAPVRTVMPGHSISAVDPSAVCVSPLALDDVLKGLGGRTEAELAVRIQQAPATGLTVPQMRRLPAWFPRVRVRTIEHRDDQSAPFLRRAYNK
jgi:hypothetical protein